jgi:hypothetical protein
LVDLLPAFAPEGLEIFLLAFDAVFDRVSFADRPPADFVDRAVGSDDFALTFLVVLAVLADDDLLLGAAAAFFFELAVDFELLPLDLTPDDEDLFVLPFPVFDVDPFEARVVLPDAGFPLAAGAT